MSIAVPLYGFGTGGNSLYYSVVCSTTEPAKKEGRIWVKSSVPMTQFEVGNNWASAKVGVVVVGGTPGGANPTSANKILDLINTKVAGIQNRLKLTPASCKQVQGSVGNWVSVDAYVCHSNTWIQFSATRNTPEFTYTGSYKLVDDSSNEISDFATWTGNWKIRFLTSGTLTFTSLNGAEGGIDVFLVGGGGGGAYNAGVGITGGGGGYTTTARAIHVSVGQSYGIQIGAGGNSGHSPSDGGATSALGKTALGGKWGRGNTGGDGGSGGGGYVHSSTTGSGAGAGGSDGSNGGSGAGAGGTGQGTTTREFGESTGKLYAGGGASNVVGSISPIGGAGGGGNPDASGEANTGGGCGGTSNSALHGGSGIVIIRNARGAA